MNIRKLTKSDIDVFFELRLDALLKSPTTLFPTPEEEQLSKTRYEQMFASESLQHSIFGIFIHSELVGFVGIHQMTGVKLNHRSHIAGLYIKPEHRNKGIAKTLMQHAIQYGKDSLHCSIINLSVTTDNHHAKKLYASLGFKAWGVETNAMKIDGTFYHLEHMLLAT